MLTLSTFPVVSVNCFCLKQSIPRRNYIFKVRHKNTSLLSWNFSNLSIRNIYRTRSIDVVLVPFIWPLSILCVLQCVKSVRVRSFSDRYFPAFLLNTERSLCIQSEYRKIQTRKTPNTDTFCAVLIWYFYYWLWKYVCQAE